MKRSSICLKNKFHSIVCRSHEIKRIWSTGVQDTGVHFVFLTKKKCHVQIFVAIGVLYVSVACITACILQVQCDLFSSPHSCKESLYYMSSTMQNGTLPIWRLYSFWLMESIWRRVPMAACFARTCSTAFTLHNRFSVFINNIFVSNITREK